MRPISHRLKSTCTLISVVKDAEPNDDGEQEATETTHTGVACLFQQHHTREGGVSEDAAKQEIQRELLLGFLEPDAPITAISKVIYQGHTYEVDGIPWHVERDGEVHHIEVIVARTV